MHVYILNSLPSTLYSILNIALWICRARQHQRTLEVAAVLGDRKQQLLLDADVAGYKHGIDDVMRTVAVELLASKLALVGPKHAHSADNDDDEDGGSEDCDQADGHLEPKIGIDVPGR